MWPLDMGEPKGEEIKLRVPKLLKAKVRAIADQRYTSESEIVREAILEYIALREKQPPVNSGQESVEGIVAAAMQAGVEELQNEPKSPPILIRQQDVHAVGNPKSKTPGK